MGHHYDCRKLANVLPDTALWIRTFLSARCCSKRGDNGSYLSRCDPLRVDTSSRAAVVVLVPLGSQHHSKPAVWLRLCICNLKKGAVAGALFCGMSSFRKRQVPLICVTFGIDI